MTPIEKPIPYKAKRSKMYSQQFYLKPSLFKEFLQQLQEGSIQNDRAAVDFIDFHGEWMNG